jgi:hypothetical protein
VNQKNGFEQGGKGRKASASDGQGWTVMKRAAAVITVHHRLKKNSDQHRELNVEHRLKPVSARPCIGLIGVYQLLSGFIGV